MSKNEISVYTLYLHIIAIKRLYYILIEPLLAHKIELKMVILKKRINLMISLNFIGLNETFKI